MNNNAEVETSIQRMVPAVQAELDRMLSDPDIRAAHDYSVKMHRAKIDELKGSDKFSAFYAELTSDRLQRLSRLHAHFGSNVFLAGPEEIPDEIVQKDPNEEFFFTVEKGETSH
jgi:L-asparaginase II